MQKDTERQNEGTEDMDWVKALMPGECPKCSAKRPGMSILIRPCRNCNHVKYDDIEAAQLTSLAFGMIGFIGVITIVSKELDGETMSLGGMLFIGFLLLASGIFAIRAGYHFRKKKKEVVLATIEVSRNELESDAGRWDERLIQLLGQWGYTHFATSLQEDTVSVFKAKAVGNTLGWGKILEPEGECLLHVSVEKDDNDNHFIYVKKGIGFVPKAEKLAFQIVHALNSQ